MRQGSIAGRHARNCAIVTYGRARGLSLDRANQCEKGVLKGRATRPVSISGGMQEHVR
jgi:hypothetical protein